jgi:hypothetical protein
MLGISSVRVLHAETYWKDKDILDRPEAGPYKQGEDFGMNQGVVEQV